MSFNITEKHSLRESYMEILCASVSQNFYEYVFRDNELLLMMEG